MAVPEVLFMCIDNVRPVGSTGGGAAIQEAGRSAGNVGRIGT